MTFRSVFQNPVTYKHRLMYMENPVSLCSDKLISSYNGILSVQISVQVFLNTDNREVAINQYTDKSGAFKGHTI